MSQVPQSHCPDWNSLLANRDQERYEEAWGRAMEHLDGCDSCRENAFAAEPLMLFQDLPTLEVGQQDIDDMKQAVAAMRRGQSVEERAEPSFYRQFLRAAAVAGFGLALLLLQGTLNTSSEMPQADSVQAAVSTDAFRAVAPKAAEMWPAQPARPLPESRPLVEEVEPLAGTMIQLVDGDIDMVVFYSDNLDV